MLQILGPLITREEAGKPFVLAGVVSYGSGCGSYPGVYQRVTSFLDYIAQVAGDDPRNKCI